MVTMINIPAEYYEVKSSTLIKTGKAPIYLTWHLIEVPENQTNVNPIFNIYGVILPVHNQFCSNMTILML